MNYLMFLFLVKVFVLLDVNVNYAENLIFIAIFDSVLSLLKIVYFDEFSDYLRWI